MPSAPTSRDRSEGSEVEDVLDRFAEEADWAQLPSPIEARIDESDFGYAVRVWRRVIVSAVKGMAEPSAGRMGMDMMRRRWSSSSSGSEILAISRTGFRASPKGRGSPVLEFRCWATPVTTSMIS